MKKYLAVMTVLILMMALIPVAVSDSVFSGIFSPKNEQAVSTSIISSQKNSGYSITENVAFTDKSTGKTVSRSSKSVVYSLVGAAVGENFSENEVKALAVAYHTQICFESDSDRLSIDTKNPHVFLDENGLKKKFGKNYTPLCSYCDNVFGSLILENGKPMNLNITSFSAEPEENTEIRFTAAPYNSLSKDYSTVFQFGSDEFYGTLRTLDSTLSTETNPQSAVGEINFLASGEVETVNICGIDFSGSDISEAFGLPYGRFTLLYSLGEFQFTVMQCDQSDFLTPNTAHFMSEQGNTYSEILNYCYA
ncbi:MAG: hypothetical protein II821_09315 [Treponema sp.]|nr:hypothetical protein [Treponema sp.]